MEDGLYETIGGAQRLAVLQEMGTTHIPCVVMKACDEGARLLSQALNRIQGKDDLGLRAELLREVLKTCPRKEVLAILPETTESLKAMASTGQDTIAEYLQAWQNAQSARLKHLTFQLTFSQLDMVEEALAQAMPMAKGQRGASPNNRGTALYLVCKAYLKEGEYRCLLNTP